jgi:hypothetical protein
MEDPMLRPLRSALAGPLAAIFLVVTACGSDEPGAADEPKAPESSATEPANQPGPTDQSSPTATPGKDQSGATINITFKGDKVEPNGVSRKVRAGEPFTLHIVADKPGEIHIHSSPEQEVQYSAGTTDKTVTIDQPGIVDVESHDLDTLIVQLEVR